MPSICQICRGNSGRLIRVPRNADRRQLWIDATETELSSSHRICEKHFDQNDFEIHEGKAKRKILLPNALPLKKVCKDPFTDQLPSEVGSNLCDFSSQTEKEVIECGIALENIRLKLKIKELQDENDRLVKKLNTAERLTESLKQIFSDKQISKLSSGQKRVNWSSEDISSGICLHSAGPRAYIYLVNKGFPFPCISTLQKWSQTVDISPGPISCIFDLMKAEVGRESEHKLCVLVFDEMKVTKTQKEPKNYVQVAMAQGLWKYWKHPIYYDFEKPMTIDTLNMLIKKLYSLEFHVVAMVSDMGPENSKLWTQLGISADKTWFEHPANADMKVFVFADASHLIKEIRNQFVDSGILVNDKLISATTIKEAMSLASSTDSSILWKINEEHLNVKSEAARKKVALATQLMSSTTASAIRCCLDLGLKVENACETADFIKLVNDWFDIFNAKLSTENSIPTMQSFGKSLNEQRKVLNDMTEIMSTLIDPNSLHELPFQEGVIVNNASLDSLYEYVGMKYGMVFLITSRISLDLLEQLFGALRSKDAVHDHPSPKEFKYRLRKHLVGNGFSRIT